MWLWIHRTTKVRSLTQQPSNSQAWAGPQPHMPEHPPSPLTQNVGVGWVREVWLFPSVSMGSTDGRVVPQKTRPSHAVCGEVSKEGRTARERHMVSSKTEGTKTLGALRREASLASQCSGQVLVLSQHRQVFSWAWLPLLPATTPPFSSTTPSLPMLCTSPILAQGC